MLALLRYYYNNYNKYELQRVKFIPHPTEPANYTGSYTAKYRVIMLVYWRKEWLRDDDETVDNNRQIIFNDKTNNDT